MSSHLVKIVGKIQPTSGKIIENITFENYDFDRDFLSSSTENNISSQFIRFYPNPFSQGITLEVKSKVQETVTLQAINSIGVIVFEQKIDVLPGINIRYMEEFGSVPVGVYTTKIISLQGDHFSRVIRIE